MWKSKRGFRISRRSLSAAFQTALFCLEIEGQEAAVIFKDDMRSSGMGYEVRFPGDKYNSKCYESEELSEIDSMAVNKLKVLMHCRSIGWNIPEKLILDLAEENNDA